MPTRQCRCVAGEPACLGADLVVLEDRSGGVQEPGMQVPLELGQCLRLSRSPRCNSRPLCWSRDVCFDDFVRILGGDACPQRSLLRDAVVRVEWNEEICRFLAGGALLLPGGFRSRRRRVLLRSLRSSHVTLQISHSRIAVAIAKRMCARSKASKCEKKCEISNIWICGGADDGLDGQGSALAA